MTQSTVWTSRARVSALLIIGGVVGLIIAGAILQLPLLLSIIIAIFVGAAGIGGAILEMIVKAIARSRAPMTFRAREPYEFVKWSNGYVNLAHITSVTLDWPEPNFITIMQSDSEPLTLKDEDAVLFIALMDEFATPLRSLSVTGTAESAVTETQE